MVTAFAILAMFEPKRGHDPDSEACHATLLRSCRPPEVSNWPTVLPPPKKISERNYFCDIFMEKLCKSTYIGMKNIFGEFNKYLRVNDNFFVENFSRFLVSFGDPMSL